MLSNILWLGLVSFCAGILLLYFTGNPISWIPIILGVLPLVFAVCIMVFLYLLIDGDL